MKEIEVCYIAGFLVIVVLVALACMIDCTRDLMSLYEEETEEEDE